MIAKFDLLKLARARLKDAHVLLDNRRYASAIYLAGYTVELALKYRMCWLYRFRLGFPEDAAEFNTYVTASSGFLRTTIKDVRQIKIHDLDKLLFFSGEEIPVKTHFATEWALVSSWTHLSRYSTTVVRKPRAERFIQAAYVITTSLI